MEEDVVKEASAFGAETDTANVDNAVPDSEKENVFGGNTPEQENDDDDGGRKKRFSKKQLIIGACIAALVVVGGVFVVSKLIHKSSSEVEYETVTVERKDIVRTVEGSSTLEANDTYNVTALVTGEVLTDTFSEGDAVTKDQVLYTIDSSEAQRKVDSAQNSLTTAQRNFADAVKKKSLQLATNANNESTTKSSVTKALENVETAKRNLAAAQEDVDNLTITANYTGTISEVLVKEGDSVNDGTKLAAIYDASKLKIQVPFNTADAETITAGSAAVLTIASSNDTVAGTVESVSSASTATASHAVVKYVTIVISNPGGLKAGEQASATVNGTACSDLGTLENYEEGYITSKGSGRVTELWLQENDYIAAGQVIGYLTSDSVTNALKSAQSSVKTSQIDLNDAYTKLEQLVIDNDTYSLDSSIQSASISLDNARISLEDAQDTLENYTITAPIDGTIIVKNNKAGDKLEQNSNSSSEPMAIIYDMSLLKVQLSIDESDIQDIQVGQSVKITADAVEGEFTGEVTKVGINGTSENGVTIYPVDITLTEYGELLPGMNVDCVIEVESAADVLAVPSEAIQRGNRVYVKGEKTEENDKAPDGYYSVSVTTGATDGTYIEIKEGLEEGQEVCGAAKSSGVEAEGSQEAQQQQQQMQGGMGGPGGGNFGGGGGGNRGGGGPGGGGPGGGR